MGSRYFNSLFEGLEVRRLLANVLPVADAAVRDGSYGSTNYGAAETMQLKNHTSGVTRENYLKFNLDALGTSVGTAKLRLYATAGVTGMTVGLNAVANDNWSETGLTWSNRPVKGQEIAAAAAPTAAGGYIEFDLTTLVNNELSTDRVLSLNVDSNTYGETFFTTFATKENANSALRPVLITSGTKPIPTAANTGTTGPLTAYVGNKYLYDNAVFENMDLTGGRVVVRGSNVVIRNCRITSGSTPVIQIESGTNVLIENCDLVGTAGSTFAAIVQGANFTLRNSDLSCGPAGSYDGVKITGDNVVIENNYIHVTRDDSNVHLDAVQMQKGSNAMIRFNNMDLVNGSQVVVIKSDSGPINNVRLYGNRMEGGNYSLIVMGGTNPNDPTIKYPAPTNVVVSYNRWGRDNQYGIYHAQNTAFQAFNNIWDDTETSADPEDPGT